MRYVLRELRDVRMLVPMRGSLRLAKHKGHVY